MESWELPILLVAQRKYLEQLQTGSLYMKNCLYYQRLETEDSQRGDKYDSAIKSDSFHFDNVKNGRLTFLTMYIKCFFQYAPENITGISNNRLALSLPKESAHALQEISKSADGYVLLIYDTEKLAERFVEACEKQELNYQFSKVTYVPENEYPKYENDLLDVMTGKSKNCMSPVFLKRDKYKSQQEFRLAVTLPSSDISDKIDKKIFVQDSISLNMRSITDISSIATLQDIIDSPWILGI